MNGWFPHLNSKQQIVSGNAGIWMTDEIGRNVQIAEVGIGPIWLDDQQVLFNNAKNLPDTRTVLWPSLQEFPAYNSIASNGNGKWTGYLSGGNDRLDVWEGTTLVRQIPKANFPRWSATSFGYASPDLEFNKTLYVDDQPVASGAIIDWVADPRVISRVVAPYTYDFEGTPIINRLEGGLVESGGWLMTVAGGLGGLFVRPIGSVVGYWIPGVYDYPDFKLYGNVLMVVGSEGGNLKIWRSSVDAPRIDLTTVGAPPAPPPLPTPTPLPTPLPTPVPVPTPPAPPVPTPTPTPKEPDMLVIDTTTPAIPAINGDIVDNGNGTISIRKTNGKIVSLTPSGTYEERDAPGGPWESFVRCSNGLYANRDWDGKLASFIVPFIEVK